MGYETLGVEYHQSGGGHAVLRVYIDQPAGITVEDCERVSRQLSAALDVEDPIAESYDLEVSSPGLDRPLFSAGQIVRFRGSRARFRLDRKLDGRRNFEGEILDLVAARGVVRLQLDEGIVELPLEHIDSARLVPDSDRETGER